MTNLEAHTKRATEEGWEVVSLSADNVVLKKKKGMNGWVMAFGILGLLFYLVPGILILLVGYVARGEETVVVTRSEADVIEHEARVALGLEAARMMKRKAMSPSEKIAALTLFEKLAAIGIVVFLVAAFIYAAL